MAIIPWNRSNIHWNIAFVDQKEVYFFEPFSASAGPPKDLMEFLERIERAKGFNLSLKTLSYTTQTDDWSCGYLCLIVIE